MKKSLWSKSLILFVLSVFTLGQIPAIAAPEAPKPWSYDAGPNPADPMGKELIDINSDIPNFPEISNALISGETPRDRQKFRPVYGPIPWRMRQAPNSVKILFIGQDGTHIAEAAGRPATAGFGGRAQDLAEYFGVSESAAFLNAYAFTIQGQAGSFTTPVFEKGQDGKVTARMSSFVDNGLWLMSYDQKSPITQWRNQLIDWILRNNRDSIKMVVLFGGAAREAAGAFLEARGAKVGARKSPAAMKNIQIPITRMVHAGANNEFCTPLAEDGGDLYADLMGDRLPSYKDLNAQKEIQSALDANVGTWIEQFVFSKGGPFKNGLLHPAQLGGYDLAKKIEVVKGQPSISIKGLKLSDGTTIAHDVLVIQLPHPSSLSKMTKQAAAQKVKDGLKSFEPFVKAGWKIEGDQRFPNGGDYFAGKPFDYGRANIGPEYYDFGAPGNRMVSKSDAVRLSPDVIQIGTRNRADFDKKTIMQMAKAQPSKMPAADEMYTTRPRGKQSRYVFDPGPGAEFAEIMKTSLDEEKLFAEKDGMIWSEMRSEEEDEDHDGIVDDFDELLGKTEAELAKERAEEAARAEVERPGKKKVEVIVDGIRAFFVKSHPSVGTFGHYRGTFVKPRVLVLADPIGADDIITARALTGSRGQFLHGMLSEMGVETDYLVLKTVPVIMDGATAEEWEIVRRETEGYRNAVIGKLLEENADSLPQLVIADGAIAAKEAQRILGASGIKIVEVERGAKAFDGIADAIRDVNALELAGFRKATGPKMVDIPRQHLSYYARLWEGTGGDRVASAEDGYRGIAFAQVAPEWAWKQRLPFSKKEAAGVQSLLNDLEQGGLPLPTETVPDYLKRVKHQ